MKRLLCLLTLAIVARAQVTLTATANPSTVRAGQQTIVTITASGTSNVAALQWNLSVPSGWTFAAAVPSAAVTAANKQVSCAVVTCILWGQDIGLVPSGVIATAVFTVPINASPGAAQLNLVSVLGSAPAGILTPVSVGAPATITVQSSIFDVTGDGKITVADMTTVAGWVIAGKCTVDLDGDGACTVADLIQEVIAWNAAGKQP